MNDFEAYELVVNGIQPAVEKRNKKSKVKSNHTRDEQIKKLRMIHKIKCNSRTCSVPEPVEKFSELICRYNLNTSFLKCFESLKYASPTAVQMQSIPVMLEGHNILTLAPTGSGKTAAFLIPILHDIMLNKTQHSDKCTPRALIVSPTIELAKQTYQECICLIKDVSEEEKPRIVFCCKDKKNNPKWRKLLNNADILICSPIRLSKMLSDEDESRQTSVENLKWLVIDESDKMLEKTFDSFYEQFEKIANICMTNTNCRIAMFSATQTTEVWDWVNENLSHDLVHVKIGVTGGTVETITQELRYCVNEGLKLVDMRTLLLAGKLKCPCLIFLDKADSAFHLHQLLGDHFKNSIMKFSLLSGNDDDSVRRNTITEFREGKIHYLICTNLLARGMDFKGVETVVNYDLPKIKEEYIHRIGRCGRAGRSGSAISLWTDSDVMNGLVDVMKIMKASNQPVNEELFELAKKRNKSRKAFDKGNKKLNKLKRKYTGEDGKSKSILKVSDKRRKVYFEKCVIRGTKLEEEYRQKFVYDSE